MITNVENIIISRFKKFLMFIFYILAFSFIFDIILGGFERTGTKAQSFTLHHPQNAGILYKQLCLRGAPT